MIPARLLGEKITGGKIELLLERFLSNHQTLTQIRSSRAPKEGAELVFSFQGQRFLATVEGRQDNFFILNWSDDPKYLFEQYGQIPLPPYMNRAAEKLDEERYETILTPIKKHLLQRLLACTLIKHEFLKTKV